MSTEIGGGRGHTIAAREAGGLAQKSRLMIAVLHDARLLLIALWLGAAVFFSAAVAPSAFAVLRAFHLANANEIAGTIVTRTLTMINVGGFMISLLLIASAFLSSHTVNRRAFYAEVIALALLGATTGINQWVISARMLALRAALGRPIDEVAQNDPLRLAFSSLHGYSVMALGVGMIGALAALLLIVHRSRANSI